MLYLESLNKSLFSILNKYPEAILLGEDIEDPYGGAFKITKGMSSSFPGRVINMPISEQAICGTGAGLAVGGMIPIVEIMFGDFLTLCFDQVLNHISKFDWMFNHKIQCPIIIRTPMGGGRGYGPTHSQSIEKHFIGIPGLTTICPSLFHNPGRLLEACVNLKRPVLFIEEKRLYSARLIETPSPVWQKKELGKDFSCVQLTCDGFEDSPDITIAVYGSMADICIDVAENLFMEMEIFSDVFIVSNLSAPPYEELSASVSRSKKLLIIEEGTKPLGWGAEIGATIAEINCPVKVKRLASRHLPIAAAPSIEKEIIPNKESIASAIKEFGGEN